MSKLYDVSPPPLILRQCLALLAVAEWWLLFDIGMICLCLCDALLKLFRVVRGILFPNEKKNKCISILIFIRGDKITPKNAFHSYV